jgi:hypothetical protein
MNPASDERPLTQTLPRFSTFSTQDSTLRRFMPLPILTPRPRDSPQTSSLLFRIRDLTPRPRDSPQPIATSLTTIGISAALPACLRVSAINRLAPSIPFSADLLRLTSTHPSQKPRLHASQVRLSKNRPSLSPLYQPAAWPLPPALRNAAQHLNRQNCANAAHSHLAPARESANPTLLPPWQRPHKQELGKAQRTLHCL